MAFAWGEIRLLSMDGKFWVRFLSADSLRLRFICRFRCLERCCLFLARSNRAFSRRSNARACSLVFGLALCFLCFFVRAFRAGFETLELESIMANGKLGGPGRLVGEPFDHGFACLVRIARYWLQAMPIMLQ